MIVKWICKKFGIFHSGTNRRIHPLELSLFTNGVISFVSNFSLYDQDDTHFDL